MTTTTPHASTERMTLSGPGDAEAFVSEWIDPAYLRLVQILSAPASPSQPSEGLLILAHLCRRALQPGLFPAPRVARLTFRGVVGLCGGSDAKLYGPWPAGRETTLKWLILLEAITLLFRFRSQGETVVLIPLGRRSPLDLGRLLAHLEAYEQRYANKKTRALLRRSRERLTRCRTALTSSGVDEQPLDRPAPAELQQQLLTHLQGEGLAPDRCGHIARWFTLVGTVLHGVEASAEQNDGTRPANEFASTGRIWRSLGDSPGTGGDIMSTGLEVVGDSFQRESPLQPTIASTQAVAAKAAHYEQDSRGAARLDSTVGDSQQSGDCGTQSNLESLSSSVITVRGSRFESEEALVAEAERYVCLLDGPLPPKSKWTKGVVTGYRNCLEQNPLLACMSLINTLLRLHCPLAGEDPLRIPRKWFHSSFNKYTDAADPMPLTEDIRSFVESPYSYEEIAQALSAWCNLNHSSLRRRPCPDDLVAAGLLPEGAGDDTQAEETAPPYPSPEAPWDPETCLALFDYYRGRMLPPELAARAQQASLALCGTGEEQRCCFERFEVESVLIAWLEGDAEVRALLPGEEGGVAFPEVWTLASAMEAAWDIVRPQLLTTGQYVEMDDGELLSYDEYVALYERSLCARREEEERNAYEHSLTYYLRLLQEEESAYKNELNLPPAEEPTSRGPEPDEREEDAEWSDPEAALRWALPLCEALPFERYGLEICMTRQWHCVLVVWSRESPQDDTLTLCNSAQVMQLIEGFQQVARRGEGQDAGGDTSAPSPSSVLVYQGPAPVGERVGASRAPDPPLRPVEWDPDG